MINTYKTILSEVNKLPGKGTQSDRAWVKKYLGSHRSTRCVKTSLIRQKAKQIANNTPLALQKLIDLVDYLYSHATTFEEMSFAASLLGQFPQLTPKIPFSKIKRWLTFCHGWAEVDTLCSTDFYTTKKIKSWEKFLNQLAISKNVNFRRASLVLLCKPLRQSSDLRLANLSLGLVEKLKFEKDILITKAVSWILRSMVKNFPAIVGEYLDTQALTLPKIALRETRKKLETGRKS